MDSERPSMRSLAPNARPVFAPCPFCGGVREKLSIHKEQLILLRDPKFQVQCVCGVRGPYGYDTEEAIIIWNTVFTPKEKK